MATGVPVYVVDRDAAERGIEPSELIDGVQSVSPSGIPALCDAHDLVWHWVSPRYNPD